MSINAATAFGPLFSLRRTRNYGTWPFDGKGAAVEVVALSWRAENIINQPVSCKPCCFQYEGPTSRVSAPVETSRSGRSYFVNVLVGLQRWRRSGIGVGLALLVVACGTGAVDSDGQPTSTPSLESFPALPNTALAIESAPDGMPGENVTVRSTVTALDVATGHELWQASPPVVYARPIREDGGNLSLEGNVSPSKCSFNNAFTKLDVASGALISAEILDPPKTLADGTPSINDGALSIGYVVEELAGGRPSYGLEAVDSTTGSTVWSIVRPDVNGPALLDPPLFGFGVIVAAVGGRNPLNRGPAIAIEFIDEQTGDTLWESPGDAAVAIGDGMAYVLNAGSLEAHEIRTGASRWRQETDATEVSANDHVVVVSGTAGTVAYDTSGKRLWEVPVRVDRDGAFGGGILVGRDSVFVVTSPGSYATQCSGG
jgi:outer membrane protein assembly factor BamB